MEQHDEDENEVKLLLRKTYKVMILMLLIGQLQVYIILGSETIKRFLSDAYYTSLVQFFLSFITIQLYVFFYNIIVQKSTWKRIVATLWTYEVNTISIMKPAKKSAYVCHLVSFVLTYLIMGISIWFGSLTVSHRYGLFVSRHNVIRWSERLFVLTSFGIIVCSEMKRNDIELPVFFIYSTMSNIFVLIFAASIREPNFYYLKAIDDHILIGQLYYLNFYALYMGYVWTTSSLFECFGLDLSVLKINDKNVSSLGELIGAIF